MNSHTKTRKNRDIKVHGRPRQVGYIANLNAINKFVKKTTYQQSFTEF